MPPAVYRDVQRSSMAYDIENISLAILRSCNGNMRVKAQVKRRNDGSCMAIYLGMAMKMP